jgi:hypothetical protein
VIRSDMRRAVDILRELVPEFGAGSELVDWLAQARNSPDSSRAPAVASAPPPSGTGPPDTASALPAQKLTPALARRS